MRVAASPRQPARSTHEGRRRAFRPGAVTHTSGAAATPEPPRADHAERRRTGYGASQWRQPSIGSVGRPHWVWNVAVNRRSAPFSMTSSCTSNRPVFSPQA